MTRREACTRARQLVRESVRLASEAPDTYPHVADSSIRAHSLVRTDGDIEVFVRHDVVGLCSCEKRGQLIYFDQNGAEVSRPYPEGEWTRDW